MKTPDTEKCEHKVVKKYCFRCKRPDLAGNVKNTPDTEIIKAVPLPHEPAVTTNGDTNGGGGSTTPDAAWKKELEQHIKFCFGGEYGDTADDAINIITAFTTNLLSSRDTYWKERHQVFVNNIIEDIENMKGVYSANDAIAKALDIIKKHTIR